MALALLAAVPSRAPLASSPGEGAAAIDAAPVWPAPPDTPRIRFLASISDAEDLGKKPSFLGRLKRIVVGEKKLGFARPLALWAGAGGDLLVSDPEAGAVYALHLEDRSFRVFASGGRLATPVGVARLEDGGAWIADADRGVLLRYDKKGKFREEVGGGRLVRPAGLGYDPVQDRLYVADAQGHRIAVFDGGGGFVTDFGRRGTGEGEFNFPTDVKVMPDGSLLVCDSMNCRVQRLSPEGAFLGGFGRRGDGRGDFARPKSVAVDSCGNIYVVDGLYDVVQIFDGEGRLLLVVGGSGTADGLFNLPVGIAIDGADRIFVADSANRRVQVFEFLGEAAR